MEIATSQLPRIWRLALIGAATAFAWIALSLLLGLGSGSAHADEGDDEGKGLLGAVTSAVDRTATTVTTTVTKTMSAVTEVVNTVVEVAPAPVQQPVQQVVQEIAAPALGRLGYCPLLGQLEGDQRSHALGQQAIEVARPARRPEQAEVAGPGFGDLERIEVALPDGGLVR